MDAVPDLNYDPTSPLVQANPYPCYASLRAYDPVQWNEHVQAWVVSRYSDVVGMLRDPRWSSNFQILDPASVEKLNAFQQSGRVMLFMDAPEHAHLRRMVAKRFDAQKIAELTSYAQALVIQFLDSFAGRDEIDLISEFSAPLSLRVLARLLGVPDKDLAIIAESADTLSGLVDWAPNVETLESVRNSGAALIPYLLTLVEQKRREPGDDLVSALVQQAKERKIRYADVVSTAILMLAAGHVTSTHILGNGVLALLQNGRSLEAGRSGRYQMGRIVDELLRFDGPVQASPRTALVDMELGGQAIRRGDKALALLGSANRDNSVFAEPDSIILDRRNALSVGFGSGPHFCIGAELARATVSVALGNLLGRYPELRLPEQALKWKSTITQRGLTALRIAL